MFDRFTERARKVIILAKEEAKRFNHDYIGTEHILLGLIKEGEKYAILSLCAIAMVLSCFIANPEVVLILAPLAITMAHKMNGKKNQNLND